jgi:hypothetical protein
VGQRPNRAVELAEEGEEDQQVAEGDGATGEFHGAEGDDDEDADQLEQADQRGEGGAQPLQAKLGDEVPPDLALEAAHLPLLAVMGLDQRRVGQDLLGDGGDGAFPLALLPRDALDAGGEAPRRVPAGGSHQEGDQCQSPVDQEEGAREEDEFQHRRDGGRDAGDEDRLDLVDVLGQPRQEVAEPGLVEEGRGQRQEVAEEAEAQVEQEALAGPGRRVLPGEGEDTAAEGEAQVERGDGGEGGEVARHEHVVHQASVEPDRGGLNQGQERGEENAEEDPAAVRPGVRPEATEHLAERVARGRVDQQLRLGGTVGGVHLNLTARGRPRHQAGPTTISGLGRRRASCGSGSGCGSAGGGDAVRFAFPHPPTTRRAPVGARQKYPSCRTSELKRCDLGRWAAAS